VNDVDPQRVHDLLLSHGRLATLTAIRPPARLGRLDLDGDGTRQCTEKTQIGEGWVNRGFLVLEGAVLDCIRSPSADASLESGGLEQLASDGQLMENRHEGFWQPMDTLSEFRLLGNPWDSGTPPWRTWA